MSQVRKVDTAQQTREMDVGENEINLARACQQKLPGFVRSVDRMHLKPFKFQDVLN